MSKNKEYCYEYPRPAVTVDLVVFTLRNEKLSVLMIRRKRDPFAGQWAFPGGFLDIEERVKAAALRELREETRLDPGPDAELAFLGFFDAPDRDPRGRTISFAFVAGLRGPLPEIQGGDDASEAAWLNPYSLSDLAFDHDLILAKGLDWLVSMIPFGSGAMQLLPREFETVDVAKLKQAVHLEEETEGDLLDRLTRSSIILPVDGSPGRFRLRD
jgi:8-oxo-dGTP diphosphatase